MNIYPGSDFDEFLEDEGLREEAPAKAYKRLLALQLRDAMQAAQLSKTQLAEQLHTSRSQLDRLLDPDYTAFTLDSLERLARALGKQLKIELAE
jgi:predicted XRE-type DNA-binding protein